MSKHYQLLEVALGRILNQAVALERTAPVRLSTVTLTLRDNPVTGPHAHARATLRVDLHDCVTANDMANAKI